MSQDAHIREQIEAAEREIERLRICAKNPLGARQEPDSTEAQIKSLEAMLAEQRTRLKRLKQQSNQD